MNDVAFILRYNLL